MLIHKKMMNRFMEVKILSGNGEYLYDARPLEHEKTLVGHYAKMPHSFIVANICTTFVNEGLVVNLDSPKF